MKRKTLTARERALKAHGEYGPHNCRNYDNCIDFVAHLAKAIRAAVRAALRKRRGQIKALEMEQVSHIEIIERNAQARVDAARAEGIALRKPKLAKPPHGSNTMACTCHRKVGGVWMTEKQALRKRRGTR